MSQTYYPTQQRDKSFRKFQFSQKDKTWNLADEQETKDEDSNLVKVELKTIWLFFFDKVVPHKDI